MTIKLFSGILTIWPLPDFIFCFISQQLLHLDTSFLVLTPIFMDNASLLLFTELPILHFALCLGDYCTQFLHFLCEPLFSWSTLHFQLFTTRSIYYQCVGRGIHSQVIIRKRRFDIIRVGGGCGSKALRII